MAERKIIDLHEGFFSRLADLLVLNLLCLFCCLPLFTIADSMAAMYYVMLKIVRRKEEGVVKPFFRFFAGNFGKSIPYSVLMMISAAAVITLAMGFGYAQNALGILAVVPAAVILLILFGWVIPLFAQFDDTLPTTFSNAVKLAVANPQISLVILAANGYLIVLFFFLPGLFGYVLYVWGFIGLSLSCRIICPKLVPVFNEMMREEDRSLMNDPEEPVPSEDAKDTQE